ncbi:amino acid ABC transporter permease [Niallia circulans]|jgi:putative S-methylcysteine transport system permease protein|uniref:ABC transporter permease n=1 Tax=Niallia circulans TaxID=1397 RepID=A0A0J1LCE3_NIACI|nr:amino acid ABC transporter permease [Niallia circulans]AYV68103.1 amino acid ABC transporter permease [Niallia circulans]AYV73519.1 amino acid ABC transporter permease [Niallia circulans]KLV26610.1 ABC transporter permease [Niallia circulans]MCM2983277.1 amino acid ABC transporter permease [Niallia circulans]MDR4316569.1 amino acid ABC transporter permease [Niallia circulans]
MNLNLDFPYLVDILPELLEFIPLTLFLAVLSMVFAIIGGLILAVISRSNIPVLKQLAAVYISFFRAIPTLVQLFLIYYGLPQIFPALSAMTAITAAILGLSLKQAAFLAEIFRAALNSVDKGQVEACLSVGMTKVQAFRRIVLPQATRNAIPATSNIFIGLIKETSLAFTLGVVELFAQGKIIAASSLKFFETYLALALLYWVLIILVTFVQRAIEKRMEKPYLS